MRRESLTFLTLLQYDILCAYEYNHNNNNNVLESCYFEHNNILYYYIDNNWTCVIVGFQKESKASLNTIKLIRNYNDITRRYRYNTRKST